MYSCQPNPETSGCRCLGVALPELRWSCVPQGCNGWGQWLRVLASRNGVCMKQGGLKTRGSDDQCEHRWGSAGRNFTIQCVGTFLKRLNLMQVRQVWVFVLLQGVGGLMQPDHGPSPAWPAWFAAMGQQTAPESQAGPWHPEPGQRCCCRAEESRFSPSLGFPPVRGAAGAAGRADACVCTVPASLLPGSGA